MSPSHLDRLLRFFHEAGELKNLMRSGWTRYEIPRPESVADHSYRMVLMAMALGARAGLDTLRLIMLCVVHDLPEALAGDITPHDGVTDEEKHKREEEALRDLVKDIPDGDAYIKLWMESKRRKHRKHGWHIRSISWRWRYRPGNIKKRILKTICPNS